MRWIFILSALHWSAEIFAQSAPLGPGRPGQKKLPPASQPSSAPTQITPPSNKPTDIKPTETKPAEVKPSEVKPTETTEPSTQTAQSEPTSQKATTPFKKPQGWMRAAGQGASFRPGAAGGSFDLFALRRVVRSGLRAEGWRFEGVTSSESLLLGAAVFGLAYPGRVTPFIEGYAGGGLWRQQLFGQNLFETARLFGAEAGAEVYLSELFFVFGAAGYRQTSREIETFEGTNTEFFGGTTFRFGVGVAKKQASK
jgi:hypothetical protein